MERTLPLIGARAEATADRPPAAFWLLPAVVALLRLWPYQASLVLEPPPGSFSLQIGYMPKDTLAYLAFVRQAAEDGGFLLANPFTTEPQANRFVLLLHWLLGRVAATLGWSASQALELSRVPLTFLFFAVLWRFLRPILPERRTRLVACLLVGLSGGVDWLFEPLLRFAHPGVAMEFATATQDVFGWSTFETLFNPLWIAGLTLAMVVLGPILAPRGPQRLRDTLAIALGFAALYLVHPYSALAVVAIAAAVPVTELVLDGRTDGRRQGRIAVALAPPLLAALALARWQAQDPVYHATASNLLGPEALSIFWYPFTFGALLLLALRGAALWSRAAHPYRFAIAGWIAVVAWLHSSPVLNGYHFLLYLHLPLCILAADALAHGLSLHRTFGVARWAGVALLAVLLFGTPFVVTARALADVARYDVFPADYGDVIVDLQRRPAGNALVPPTLGNLLPAYTPHRVWVGHWFMTPDKPARAQQYEAWTRDPAHAPELESVVERARIAYLVVPVEAAPALAQRLGGTVAERVRHGALELLVLRGAGTGAPGAAAERVPSGAR